jgi:hypothetical protein
MSAFQSVSFTDILPPAPQDSAAVAAGRFTVVNPFFTLWH